MCSPGLVHRKPQTEDTPKSQSVPKMRGPMDKRLNALAASKPCGKSQIPVRSPLATVNTHRPSDFNSPKPDLSNLSKQPLPAATSGNLQAVFVDKENQH